MKFEIVEVLIKKIIINDAFFRITTRYDTEDLMISIQSLGLLSYPYLIKIGDYYTVVSGFRRVIACDNLGYKSIKVKVICAMTSKIECAKLAIADNTFRRELNIVELSRCYHLLKVNMEKFECSRKLGLSIGLKLSMAVLRKIEPICSLPWPIQEGLIEGWLSLPVAIKIGSMKDDAVDIFIKLFKELNTTLNNQRKIMELMIEISMKDTIPLSSLNTDLCLLFLNQNISCTQKTDQIYLYLKKKCYPIITSTFNDFDRKLKQLQLHKHVKLIPPKFFEGSSYTLNMVFNTSKELISYKEDIDKIINNMNFLSPF